MENRFSYINFGAEIFPMTENRGMFIVIEGSDASGKQTQTRRIVEWLRSSDISNIDSKDKEKVLEMMPGDYPAPETDERIEDSIENGVWKLSFPTYEQTAGGRVVDAYLSGRFGKRSDLSLEDIVNIFAADRKPFKHPIHEFVRRGGIVVSDRYREANLIHHLVDYEGEEWEEKLEYIKSVDADLPDADRVIYLDISAEEAKIRMADKDKDIHEIDEDYMKQSNRNGRKVAKHEGWKIIDGKGSKEEVFGRIKRVVDREL